MFKISKSDSFFWPVKVSFPLDDGRFATESFDVKFKRLPQSKLKALINAEGATDLECCKEVMLDWRGVTDDDGTEIPFSEASRDKLLDVAAVAKAIVQAYVTASQGDQRKN